MVESGSDTQFALKTPKEDGVALDPGQRNLDRDAAPRIGLVFGAVDRRHAASSDRLPDDKPAVEDMPVLELDLDRRIQRLMARVILRTGDIGERRARQSPRIARKRGITGGDLGHPAILGIGGQAVSQNEPQMH